MTLRSLRKNIFRTAVLLRQQIINYRKRRKGYLLVNPYGKWWSLFPKHRMKGALEEVFRASGISLPFAKAIEHGCGNGNHYSPMLKQFTRRLIGVDILEKNQVGNMDDYLHVSIHLEDEYFSAVDSASVDAVIVLASVGINIHADKEKPHSSQWTGYFTDFRNRQGRYFAPKNYPRLLKKGGYLIVLEWEAYPELRFGRGVKFSDVPENIDRYYPHPNIPQFKLVAKGFASARIGPYIVYQKTD